MTLDGMKAIVIKKPILPLPPPKYRNEEIKHKQQKNGSIKSKIIGGTDDFCNDLCSGNVQNLCCPSHSLMAAEGLPFKVCGSESEVQVRPPLLEGISSAEQHEPSAEHRSRGTATWPNAERLCCREGRRLASSEISETCRDATCCLAQLISPFGRIRCFLLSGRTRKLLAAPSG